MAADGGADAALRAQCEALRRERDRLKLALERALKSVVVHRGHLHQHQSEDDAMGLLKADWELRYFTLGSGGLLRVYESDRDVGREAGALLNLVDCTVEIEPPDVDRPWAMRVTERNPLGSASSDAGSGGSFGGAPPPPPQRRRGSAADAESSQSSQNAAAAAAAVPINELLLVSADSPGALLQWADAFERVGVKVAWPVPSRAPSGLSSRIPSAPQLQRDASPAPLSGPIPGPFAAAAASRPVATGKATAAAAPSSPRAALLARAAAGERGSAAAGGGGGGLLRTLSVSLALPPLMTGRPAVLGDDDPLSPSPPPSPSASRRIGGSATAAAAAKTSASPARAAAAGGGTAAVAPGSPGGGRQYARLPSKRWVREPAKEEFVAFPTVEELLSETASVGARRSGGASGSTLGRSVSTSAIPSSVLAVVAAAGLGGEPSGQPPLQPPATPPLPRPSPLGGAAAAGRESVAAAAAAAAAGGGEGHRRRGRPARVMWGSTAVHTAHNESLLTARATYSQTHSGLITLALVVLVTTHLRAILENLLVYRLRLTLLQSEVLRGLGAMVAANTTCLLAVPGLLVFAAAGLGIERLALWLLRADEKADAAAAKKDDGASLSEAELKRAASAARRAHRARAQRHEAVIVPLAGVNCAVSLLLPCWLVFYLKADPFPAMILTIGALVLQMKLMSYHHHCWHLRKIRRTRGPAARAFGERGAPEAEGGSPDWAVLAYPENLTVANMGFFLAVPTLLYQVNYPLIPRRRPQRLLRWGVAFIALSGLELLLIDQLLVPAMLSGLRPLAGLDLWHFCERVLGLALPTLYVWLLGFVLLFDLWLNILGELTRFADRSFYRAWWNAPSLDAFWRHWNAPVHNFLMRTIYFPLIRMGVNKWWALIVVFWWSAVAHEVAVGVPFRILKGWAFLAMFGQIPLISLTAALRARLKNDAWGNAIFWTSFCILGQPLCILLYCHEFLSRQEAVGRLVVTDGGDGSSSAA